MSAKRSSSSRLRFAAVTLASLLACASALAILRPLPAARPIGFIGFIDPAAPSAAMDNASEFEETLFLQNPHLKNAQGAEIPGILLVVSVPQPIQKYCMGRTSTQCSAIDYCIRATTKTVPMCQNLPPSLRSLPAYPPGMRPNRLYSISFSHQAPGIPGFDALRRFFENAHPATLDTFSIHARFKAKVRFTTTATDGNFELLEVLSMPAP